LASNFLFFFPFFAFGVAAAGVVFTSSFGAGFFSSFGGSTFLASYFAGAAALAAAILALVSSILFKLFSF